ncbi:MAG: PSD1 domain-containing protein [Planctomycetales bacterium]|nr:PSD1 domain-containing protein [Planctomycetales bacterium]
MRLLIRSLALSIVFCFTAADAQDATVDFDQDVQPILSNYCFECHGPDQDSREADLRFDTQDGLLESGVIQPNRPDDSNLLQRILSDDPDLQMPPPSKEKRPTAEEIQTIKDWISSGAQWETHWSFTSPERPALDESPNAAHPIDQLIQKRLTANGLSPSPAADRATLARRLAFDLTGLPPDYSEVAKFVADDSPNAYERYVDQLLHSPHYGERMAIYWLDVVRFADSNGYHSDEPRSIAPFRDYIIESFNQNVPYDQLIVEHLAGDLLPNATVRQKVASGFNMLLQTTNEGGAQAKEYLAKYAADRVRNTGTIFLGLTLGCAECHDHKFDPFTTKEFYQFAAFFADIQEQGVGNPPAHPVIEPDDQQTLDEFDAQLAELKGKAKLLSDSLAQQTADWEAALAEENAAQLTADSGWSIIGPISLDGVDNPLQHAWPAESDPDNVDWQSKPLADGQVHALPETPGVFYLRRTVTASAETPMQVQLGSDDAVKVWVNAKVVHQNDVRRGVAANQDQFSVQLNAGANSILVKIVNYSGGAGFYFQAETGSLPTAIAAILQKSSSDRSEEERQQLAKYHRSQSDEWNSLQTEIESAERQRQQFVDSLPKTLMTVSTQPRTMRILARGNWMDDSGEEVQPAVPSIFQSLNDATATSENERPNRLDLAHWIASNQNPLTARVFVNRLWKLYFGKGLAEPLDDLGAQGTRPIQPELLDWLAIEFMESNWDVRHMVKTIVMSQAYQQTSVRSEQLAKVDPYNRLLARQASFRLDAEMVRDNALAISGLLVRTIGGESVKPYQPKGYWRHMNFPVREWQADEGDNLYRRGLYTWWQRMFLHPSMLAFDAPSREECTVERARSNTPQQALVLLNDPTYVESARQFARRVLTEGGDSMEAKLNWAFQTAVARSIRAEEQSVLLDLIAKHTAEFQSESDSADAILNVGASPVPDDVDKVELAAWTSVCRVILNLHETITRR